MQLYCKLLHCVMQNYSSDASALETCAHSGSHGKGYFNNFSLIYEFITSNPALIYTVWHCISDACCLRKLMLHSGNHMGSWRAARRPAEHSPTFTQTFPAQDNLGHPWHGLHWPRSQNTGTLYVLVTYNHRLLLGQMHTNMINERSCVDTLPLQQVTTWALHFLMSHRMERIAEASPYIHVSSLWTFFAVVALNCDKIYLASSMSKGIYVICSVKHMLFILWGLRTNNHKNGWW